MRAGRLAFSSLTLTLALWGAASATGCATSEKPLPSDGTRPSGSGGDAGDSGWVTRQGGAAGSQVPGAGGLGESGGTGGADVGGLGGTTGPVGGQPGAGGIVVGSGGAAPGAGGADVGSGGATPGAGGADVGSGGATPGAGGADVGAGGDVVGSGGAATNSGGANAGGLGGSILGLGGAVLPSGGAPGSGGTGTGPCFNGVQDQDETDLDCGGVCGPSCVGGQVCAIPNDCFYGICTNNVCVDPTCDDGLLNQGETAIDCGGPCGPTCEVGERCVAHTDCVSAVCDLVNYECIPPSCTDGVYNQDESDIDCGGVCDPCTRDKVCNVNTDCVSNDCVDNICAPAQCENLIVDADESDVDCGGVTCPGCLAGQACVAATDCDSGVCTDLVCAAPACPDGVVNQDETDLDCGGANCPPCADDLACLVATDCVNSICEGNSCVPGACDDGVLNQDETDLDCGGAACAGTCRTGEACLADPDCFSNTCVDNLCEAGACADPGLGIVASYQDNSSGPSSNSIGLHFNILNGSASALDLTTVEVRYWFTVEGSGTMVAECDYAVMGCTNVESSFSAVNPVSDGADTYASITFTSGSIPAGGESQRVELRLHTSGYTDLDQSNDFSFVEGAAYIDNPNITVYADGVMVWGCLPEPL